MQQIDPALRRKMPARVVDTRPVLILRAPYHDRSRLVASVNAGCRRGEIQPLQARPVFNSEIGRWEFAVREIRPPAPAWVRPVLITVAVLSMLGSLAGLAWWVLTTLAALPLALFLAGVLTWIVCLARLGRPRTITIVQHQKVTIR